MVINKKSLFSFYYKFYRLIELKDKNIKIFLGEKSIESKNCILFSFLDFTEILNNLNFKKGTLFYEYISSNLKEIDFEDSDNCLSDIAAIVKKLIENSDINIDYEIDDDIDKILFNCVAFKCQLDILKIDDIFNKLLGKIILNNLNKTFVIFFDSSLLNLNIFNYDNCYSFDISLKLNNYNLICSNEISAFNIDYIIAKLESIWPIEFNSMQVKKYIVKYFELIKINFPLQSYNETEYLVYILLNKIYNYSFPIQNFCIISDNVKSFLTKI